jgi:iron complex outermembrane receptor protein
VKIQTRLKGAAAPVALCAMLAAQPVLAQDKPEAEDAATTEAAAQAAEDAAAAPAEDAAASEDEGAIFVTGSRLRRDEFSAPAPVAIVDPEIAVRQGLNSTADMVQGSPIAAGSAQVTDALSSNFVTNGGVGAQTVSLRGLGAERTLVLLNGRRAGPAGTRGAVSSFDLNVLPQSIVQRVELLKDGASSIYGSDAIAGVVNLITKTDTDGIELNFFTSVPFESGGEQYSASATWGKTFDRGHVLVSANYDRREELTRGDRSYLDCPRLHGFTDESFTTRADLVDPRTGEFQCVADSDSTWGHVWTYDYSYYYYVDSNLPYDPTVDDTPGNGDVWLAQFSYPGDNLGQYIPSFAVTQPGQIGIPAGWYFVGYDSASEAVQNNYHPRARYDSVIPKTDLYTLYADAAYEVTDWAEVYFEGLYNKRKNYVNLSSQVYMFGFGADGFAGLAPSLADPFAPGWTGLALFSPTGFTDLVDSSVEVDYYRGVAGFRGDISSDWSYDVYGQYSRSEGTYRNQTALNDAIETANFRSGSCVGTTTEVSDRPCVDVDWYSPRVMFGDFTPQEADFLFAWDEGNTLYTQKYVEAIVTGEPLDLWAGTVGVALGATIREDKINDVPGAIQQANNGFHLSGAGVTAGKSVTKEAFAEISIPLLRDIPLVRRLDFTGAARVTNVTATRASDGLQDTTNGNWTYKLALDWELTDFLRLRGTYGTSYRAPALFEQFLADQTSGLTQRQVDPCIQWGLNLAQGNISQQFADNCAADGVPANHTGSGIGATIVTGGGIGVLEPETSKAWTASVILTPRFEFLPDTDVSLAIDYFDIEVNGEIAQLGPGSILSQCYASDFGLDDPVCDQFSRVNDLDPDSPYFNLGNPNNVAVIFDSFLNVNSQINRGVDVTARVVHDFSGDTTLSVQGQMTWQTDDRVALFSGLFEDNNGEAGEPEWVGDFNVALDTGPWTFFYGLDVVGGTDDRQDYIDANGGLCRNFVTYDTPVCAKLTTEAQFYHSASFTREINDVMRITMGMSNITDNGPPRVTQIGGNGVTTLGDSIQYSQYDYRGRRAFINVNVSY